jgi:hypothetical protein
MRVRADLVPLERSDYAACADGIVERLAASGLVRAVLQFGTVRHPGISDLDLLVVADRDDPAALARIRELVAGAPHAGYCLFHEPSYALPRDLPFLHLFHTLEHLRPLYGTPPPHRPEEDPLRTLAWNSYFYRLLLEARAMEEASLRLLLLLARNLATTIAANDVAAGTNEHPRYGAAVDEVRVAALAGDEGAATGAVGLLGDALEIVRRQDPAGWTPRLIRDGRTVFAPGPVALRRFRGLAFFSLPARYFAGRDAYARRVAALAAAGVEQAEFEAMRARLGSVRFLDV